MAVAAMTDYWGLGFAGVGLVVFGAYLLLWAKGRK